MESAAEQEAEIWRIMADMHCPKGFPCYDSGFEDLPPVKVLSSIDAVACCAAKESLCRTSSKFDSNTMICECPVRRYVELECRSQPGSQVESVDSSS